MVGNKALMYNSVPVGWPEPGKDLTIESTDFDVNAPPPSGGLTTKNLYVTFDPAQRSSMRDPSVKSYNQAAQTGKPLVAATVIGKVLKSDTNEFNKNDLVLIFFTSTEEYSVVPKDKLTAVKLLNPANNVPLTAYLGALGMTGMTAYGSLHEIGQMKKGETLVVSAAAGAVGQIVGQIAIREGLKVIGSVGSDKKLDFITKELGFTSGFNYKKETFEDALNRLAPDGIDIYFDNVGGELLDAVLFRMNAFGRVIACGTVSQYNNKPGEEYRIKNYVWINRKRIRYQGFIVMDDNIKKYEKQRDEDLTKWIADGSLKSIEHVVEGGMDKAIDGFMAMLKGDNLGRTVLKIADA